MVISGSNSHIIFHDLGNVGICVALLGHTWHSGCAIAMVLLSVYICLRQFWGGQALDAACPKHVILFADVTSLKGTVTSYVMSQCCMCTGHMTFHYKRAANTSVGASFLLFIRSSGSTLSPETRMWLVSNMCGSQCV